MKKLVLVGLVAASVFVGNVGATVYNDSNGCYSYIDDTMFSKGGNGMDRIVSWSGTCVKDNKGLLRANGYGKQTIIYHRYITFQSRVEGDEIVGIFNGEMKEGMPIKGRMDYPSIGGYDEGSYNGNDGGLDGVGIKKRKDKTIEGKFKNGKLDGFVKITYPDGRTETGLYQDDKLLTSCADEKECKKKKADIDKKAQDETKKFLELGKCEAGETVIHRETWDSTTSSGNFLADAFFNAAKQESFLIEFEGVVKGFMGKKVEVYLQEYSVKQTKGGGIFNTTNASSDIAKYADKRVGKSYFFDKSRCSK